MIEEKNTNESQNPAFLVGAVMRSCIHCGNKDQSKFDVWEDGCVYDTLLTQNNTKLNKL